MARKIEINIGERYGSLTVLENLGGSYWWCKCECGNEDVYLSSEIVRRKACSLNCPLNNHHKGVQIYKKHGGRANGQRERLYRIWDGMIGRCERSSQDGYFRYGGRGITVCEEWRNDYAKFRSWALSNGYSDELTIDRIDNKKGYEPCNCRWVSYYVQANNRSNNIKLKICDNERTMSQISREYGINYGTLRNRLSNKKCLEDILAPARRKKAKSSCKNTISNI